MTEAERERILEMRIKHRLATDGAYRYAANAEIQAAREQEITREENYRLDRRVISSNVDDYNGVSWWD
jgi:hypothetical protein